MRAAGKRAEKERGARARAAPRKRAGSDETRAENAGDEGRRPGEDRGGGRRGGDAEARRSRVKPRERGKEKKGGAHRKKSRAANFCGSVSGLGAPKEGEKKNAAAAVRCSDSQGNASLVAGGIYLPSETLVRILVWISSPHTHARPRGGGGGGGGGGFAGKREGGERGSARTDRASAARPGGQAVHHGRPHPRVASPGIGNTDQI